MSSRSKGFKAERKAEQELQSQGYLTYRVKGSTRWNREVDMFGLFDILAIKKTGDVQRRVWLQVKCNRKPTLKPYIDFRDKYCSGADSIQLWVWVDRKGFQKTIL